MVGYTNMSSYSDRPITLRGPSVRALHFPADVFVHIMTSNDFLDGISPHVQRTQ